MHMSKGFTTSGPDKDTYTHGYAPAVTASHGRRSATRSARHLLPHLRPGMRVLDVGCGPGSVTWGFLEHVPGGLVVGLDVEDVVLEMARANLEQHQQQESRPAEGRVVKGSVYSLPFRSNSFDVCHAHQVLQHLTQPVSALAEMLRVLAPGGILSLREADYQSMLCYPEDPLIDRWRHVVRAVATHNGCNLDAGRYVKKWCREVGVDMTNLKIGSDTVLYSSGVECGEWGDTWAARSGVGSDLAAQACALQLMDAGEATDIAKAWRRWAASEDAIFYYVDTHVIGRV